MVQVISVEAVPGGWSVVHPMGVEPQLFLSGAKAEMRARGFVPTKRIALGGFPRSQRNDWAPVAEDIALIKARLAQKISLKPAYYTYRGERRGGRFLLGLVAKAR